MERPLSFPRELPPSRTIRLADNTAGPGRWLEEPPA